MADAGELTVLLATQGDLPRVLALSNWAAEHTPANFATEPETLGDWTRAWQASRETHPWLVAWQGAGIVGFARGSPHRARGAYRWTAEVSVYVDAAARGRGVGAALYQRLVPTMRAQGYVTLLAGIAPPNPASERLHAAHGFARCGTFHRAGWKLGAWHDVEYWELQLQPRPHDGPPGPVRSVESVWPGV